MRGEYKLLQCSNYKHQFIIHSSLESESALIASYKVTWNTYIGITTFDTSMVNKQHVTSKVHSIVSISYRSS